MRRFELAGRQGEPGATEMREALARSMNHTETAEAKRRARQWQEMRIAR